MPPVSQQQRKLMWAAASKKGGAGGVPQGSHTLEDVQAILAAQRNRCAYCRKPLKGKYHVDHIVPLVSGGTNDRSNLQCCCPRCNTSKGTRLPEQFARQKGLLV